MDLIRNKVNWIQLYYRSIQPSPSWSCPFLPFRRKATLPWILNLKIDFNRDHFHRDQPFPEWQFLPPLFCKPSRVHLLSSFFFRFLLVLLRKKDPVWWVKFLMTMVNFCEFLTVLSRALPSMANFRPSSITWTPSSIFYIMVTTILLTIIIVTTIPLPW